MPLLEGKLLKKSIQNIQRDLKSISRELHKWYQAEK